MTIEPFFFSKPKNVEQAYHNVRYSLNQFEEQLEAHDATMDDKSRKRADKAVTVIKVGIKIIKKAFGLHKKANVEAA